MEIPDHTWDWYEPALLHYRHRIDRFLRDEKVEYLASPQFRQDLEELKTSVDLALKAWEKIRPTLGQGQYNENFKNWKETHERILEMAKAQFKKDYEEFRVIVDSQLSKVSLEKLKKIYDKLAVD